MRLSQFKESDIITRTAPTERIKDHSYCGDPLEYVGFDKSIIVLIDSSLHFGGPRILTLDAFDWDDNNWDYYPTSLLAKAKARLKVIASAMKPN